MLCLLLFLKILSSRWSAHNIFVRSSRTALLYSIRGVARFQYVSSFLGEKKGHRGVTTQAPLSHQHHSGPQALPPPFSVLEKASVTSGSILLRYPRCARILAPES